MTKVLVMADSNGEAELVAEACRASDYMVVFSDPGVDGLEKAKAERPDLILLEDTGADSEGFQFLHKMKIDARLAETPVMLLSGGEEGEGKFKGLASGAADYVQRPFRRSELQQRMRNVLELEAARRRLREAEVELASLRATDIVTGVGNFQRLRAVLDYEYNRAARYSRPLSCAVLSDESIDSLLSVNGRLLADQILKRTSDIIRSEVREVDRVFRVDLSEFVIVLPETTAAGAAIALQRIAEQVLEQEGETGHHPILYAALASFPHSAIARAEDLYRALNVALGSARSSRLPTPVTVEFKAFG